MSVYRVISNYYNDLLNFLNEESSKNNGLDNWFQSITNDKKKMIITRLADMMVHFDVAFANEINFWQSKAKEQTWFTIIYIVMLIIILVITIILFLVRLKELQTRSDPTQDSIMMPLFKSGLSHIIVFQVLLSIFMVFLIKISSTKKLCKGQQTLLRVDQKQYTDYLFTGTQRGQMATFFTFLGYWRRNSANNYKRIFKDLQKDSSYDDVLSMFNIDTKSKTTTSDESSQPSNIGKEVAIYDALRQDIEPALIMFYKGTNDEGGYISVKKMLINSSPILMLKESRRIMSFYYAVSFRKNEEDANAKQKQQDIITNTIVNPLYDLLKASDPSETVDDTASIAQNEQNKQVAADLTKLFIAFTFLTYFAYPIYIKTLDTDPNFPIKELIPYMPHHIIIVEATPNKPYVKELQSSFTKVYNTDYKTILEGAKTSDDSTSAVTAVITKMVPLFRDLYYKLFSKIQGNTQFPFNKNYVEKNLNEIFNAGAGSLLPVEYKDTIISLIYEQLVTRIASDFDVLSIKRAELIDSMSTVLMPYKLNIQSYQNYIINSIVDKDQTTEKYLDELTEFLNELSKAITLKSQLHEESKAIDQRKFMEPDDFIELLQNMSYNDLKSGFEVKFYKDIIDKFYNVISESVSMKSANNRNIYYQRQTSIKTWRVATTMVIITLVLLLVRTLMSVFGDFDKIKKIQVQRDCDKLFAERDLVARKINVWIKLILPIFIVGFIIAMIFAFRKKMEYAFDFNMEIIENNTNELKSSLDDFALKLDDIESELDGGQKIQKFKVLDQDKITDDDKKELFDLIKNIVDKYEKCNYIIESAKTQIPFPYPEVIMNGFMMTIALLGLLYAISTFAPIKRLRDIKKLNKLKARVMISDNIQDINEEISSYAVCHSEDMDSIVIALKLIFFTFIIMFLIFYSVKIASSANDFRFGLYNSAYFEESRCYE